MKRLCILVTVAAIGILAVAQSFKPSGEGHLKPLTDKGQDIGGPNERWRTNFASSGYFRGENDQLLVEAQNVGQRAGLTFKVNGTNVGGIMFRNGLGDALYIGGYGDDVTTNTFLFMEQDGNVFVTKNKLILTNGIYINGKLQMPHTQTQTLNPTDQISTTPGSVIVVVGSGGLARTLVSTPTIPPGQDGDIIILTGDSATATVTIQDESIAPGTQLRLQSQTRVLALYKRVTLQYSGPHAAWEELTPPAPPAAPGGGGDVTAANPFPEDNRVIVSDGVGGKGIKSSPVTVSPGGGVTGVDSLVTTGQITVPNVAYNGSTWSNDFTVPTKNAVATKIEAIVNSGPVTSANTFGTNYMMVRADTAASPRGLKSIDSYAFDNGTLSNMNQIYMRTGATIQYGNNNQQYFVPTSVAAGINVGSYNGYPSAVANGGIWYHTGKQCLWAMYASSSSYYAISPRDDLNIALNEFKASGSPSPTFSATNDTDQWGFPDSQTSVIQCQFPVGHSWGAPSINIMFSGTNTTGNVVWALQTMASTVGGAEAVNGSGYGGAVNLSAAPVNTTITGGLALASGSIPLDGVTGAGNGILFKLRIQRRGADAGDTYNGDAYLHAVKIDWVRQQ